MPTHMKKKAKGQFKKADLISEIMDEKHPRKYIEGKDITRYSINRIRYLEYGTKRSPAKLRRPTFEKLYTSPKILINKMGILEAMFDNKSIMCDQTNKICILWKDLKGVENKSISASIKKFSTYSREEMEVLSEKLNLYYLLAILNSTYINILLDIIRGVGNIDINTEYLRNLPIPIAPPADMQALSDYAKQELALHQKLKEATLPQDKAMIENSIKALDNQIDVLVYKIYGLTKEEIEKLSTHRQRWGSRG